MGNDPVFIAATANGAGSWSGGAGSFGNASNASTTYTPTAGEIGTTVTLTWTTNDSDGNGPCASASDEVKITINRPATVEAGEAKLIFGGCLANGSGTVTLSGASLGGSASTGTWTIFSQPLGGDGVINGAGPDANPADATFSASVIGTYVLTLTTNDPAGPCPAVSDQVVVTVVGSQKIDCLVCMSEVRVTLGNDCRFLVTPELVMEGFKNCPYGNILKDALEVVISDGNSDSYVSCAGTYDYIVRVKKEYGSCFQFTSCWGKIIAEDKTAPVLVCAPADITLDCYDVNYVLNNKLTIGDLSTTDSPRPAGSATDGRTILNAEGTSTLPSGPCSLPSSMLVGDAVKNLGYAYYKDNCFNCGCKVTLKWTDKVIFYSCDEMKSNGGYYAIIEREWVATDCNGMRADAYIQKIKFKRPILSDFEFSIGKPTDRNVTVEKGVALDKVGYNWTVTYQSCTPDKSLILHDDVTPYVESYFHTSGNPRLIFLDKVECNYSVTYKDTEFPICNGKGVKIDRELYVFDWCAGGIVDTFHILIKIGDFEAPKIDYAHHAPYEISTGPMDCTAAFPVTVAGIKSAFGVEIKDNCSVPTISVSVYTKDRYVKGILVYEGNNSPFCNNWARTPQVELRNEGIHGILGPDEHHQKEDICWDKVEYAVMNGQMIGVPVGKHLMVIDAFDGCYNTTSFYFVFEVKDKIAPVMKCDDDLHVTLSNANGYVNGYAQVTAEDIDEGSWDNCKLAWIAVRRNVPVGCEASFTQKGYDSNGNGKIDAVSFDNTQPKSSWPIGDDDFVNSSDNQIYDGIDLNGDGDINDRGEAFSTKGGKVMTPLQNSVDFFCCDLEERVTIELWGADASGNWNYCWNDVLIEDKVAPTCVAPWGTNVKCTDKRLAIIEDKVASAAAFGDVTITSGNDCGDLDTLYTVKKDLKCGYGTITRTWTLTKQTVKGPIVITCSQEIRVDPVHEYDICFPKDASSDCKTPIIDTVLTDELGCDILAVNVSDKRYDAAQDECYKIFRTYTVINWCAYDDRCGDPMADGNVYVVERSKFENYGKLPVYLLVRDREYKVPMNGRFYAGNGAENSFDQDGDEEFWLSLDKTVGNTTRVENISRPDELINADLRKCNATDEYYHSFMYTQIIKVYDSEAPVVTGKRDTFCTSATACTANITKVVTIKDNCTDLVELEQRQLMIAPNQTTDAGAMILHSTPRWSTKALDNGQFEITVTGLPEGTHDLIVVGRDECGNLSAATRIPFVIKDCKAPAPICINGLSTELMPDGNGGGMMSVWANDFVASKIYDCNGQGPETKDGLKLITKYSINRVGQVAKADQTGLTLNCTDAGKTVMLELHAWDEAGNHDFCVTYIDIQDNRKVCTPVNPAAGEISGLITTDDLRPLLGVNIDLSGGAQMTQNTAANGAYVFNNLTKDKDYTVAAQLDKDHLNGVSTFDLVQIQKHILGVKALDNPYRMIAADVNNSKSISTIDMIQIRKLILNIDTKFNNVPSWKFVDATYKFAEGTNPWSEVFPEVVNINDLAGKVKADFIAIKMGDVNGNASASGAVATEIRGAQNLQIITEEQQLKTGESYTVVFKAKDLARVQGYQFTLNVDPSLATIEGIDYNGVMKAESFGFFQEIGTLTTSFVRAPLAGAPAGETILFTLMLKATSNTALSRTLDINSRMTHAEAYDLTDGILDVKLGFGASSIADRAALRQNTPNPFSDETAIGFYLPAATRAKLTIRDVKGALIYRVEGNYSKGNNEVILKQEQLRASGVMYYTLETSDFTDTKKMVLLNR